MVTMAGRFAFFCFLLGIFLSEGIKFSHPDYIIVLTAGSDKGPVAKIEVEESASDITYDLEDLEGPQLLDFGNNGKLNLLKKLDDTVTAEFKNKKFKLTAHKLTNGHTASASVKIVVLPSCYGDKFVPLVKVEQDLNGKGSAFEKITPRALLRFLRQPSETGRKIALAELKLQRKIAKIKKMIALEIAREHGSDALIKFYLHIKALFCTEMMDEMDRETECIKPVEASGCSCPLNPRFSTIDGTCNNIFRPTEGASNTGFTRLLPAQYFDADGLNDPLGYPDQPNAPVVPSPLSISRNFIKDEVANSPKSSTLTHVVMQFGQFIDHDLDLAVEVEFEGHNICLDVPCDGSTADFTCPCYPILPNGDAPCIRVTRSAAVCQEHGYPKPREQINVNTAPIDASQVYGSTERVAEELRETEPDRGLLKSLQGRDGEILPLDPSMESEEQLCNNLGGCFIAGDSRSNEQMSLAAFHSLFLREHNRIARNLKAINNHWDGERVYQETRRIMGAVMQKITYVDFLPTILGPNALPKYEGYKPCVNLGISNVFATAAFRFGHSLIRPSFDILNKNFDPVGDPIELRFMFFNNTFIQRDGIQPLLLGLIGNFSEKVDRTLSAGLTRHLFERENSPGSNLAALNIQRHRDHGLPGYNDFRVFCGLRNATTFADTVEEITDSENIDILKQLYGDNPNLVEVWVAGLAETPVNSGSVGATFHCIIKDQFQRTRDGDQFFYERKGVWRPQRLAQIRKASLSRIYCDNLKITSIQPNAFEAPTDQKPRINCDRIPGIDLCKWKESEFFGYPCAYGVTAQLTGKCKCVCKSPWRGERCDYKLVVRVPWHVKILNANKEVVCSGALVQRLFQRYILTTASCAQRASKSGFVKLSFSTVLRPIKHSQKLGNGLAYILPKSTVRITNARPIRLAKAKSKRPGFVSVPNGIRTSYFVRSSVSGSSKVCKDVFKVFDASSDICTLPAALPSTTANRGSPLVQYIGPTPYLVGILTDDAESSSSGLRFGKYAKV